MLIKKVLFLGPAGSYSDAAKNKFDKYFDKNCCYEQQSSIYKIIRKLKELNSESIAAVIPIENSIEGVVRDTQDNLAGLTTYGIRILAETGMAIEHSLIGFAEKKGDIKTISSHPQALAQCRDYIYKNWKDNITEFPVLSTSFAVSSLKNTDLSQAAIGSEYCAMLYGIPVIERKINDEKNNTTRFVLLSKIKPEKTRNDKVSITFSTVNQPGALNKVLNILEKYNLNMSYIDSRPSKKQLGEYVFYIDFDGHISDPAVSFALQDVLPYVNTLEILSVGANCI